MKGNVSIRPSTNPSWNEIPVVWNPTLLPPGGTSKITFDYEWVGGTTYFIRVMTEKGLETLVYGKAP